MQQIIIDADAAASERYTAGLSKDDDAILERWESENLIEIVNLTEEERAVFFEYAQPVYDYYRENGGPRAGDILDLYYSEIDNYK